MVDLTQDVQLGLLVPRHLLEIEKHRQHVMLQDVAQEVVHEVPRKLEMLRGARFTYLGYDFLDI